MSPSKIGLLFKNLLLESITCMGVIFESNSTFGLIRIRDLVVLDTANPVMIIGYFSVADISIKKPLSGN